MTASLKKSSSGGITVATEANTCASTGAVTLSPCSSTPRLRGDVVQNAALASVDDAEQLRQCMSHLKRGFQKLTKRSPLLQSKPSKESMNDVAFFHRSEIKIGRLLGQGGFSKVYEIQGFDLSQDLTKKVSNRNQRLRESYRENAVDSATGQGRYVLKHLKPELLPNADASSTAETFATAATDLLVEASLMLRLKHENVLTLRGLPAASWSAYEDGTHDGFFLILDRLSDTLDHRIDRWASEISEKDDGKLVALDQEKLQYSLELASALEYLHTKRLVYRDLKPGNVGFDMNGKLILFDLGLSRELPSDESNDLKGTYKMSCVGTRRYQAPEVLWNAVYNCKADVYGWAIVVWEMFALALPYSAYSVKQHAKYVIQRHERPPLDASEQKNRHTRAKGTIPLPLRTILMRAWDPSVSGRASMRSVRRALQGKTEWPSSSSSVSLAKHKMLSFLASSPKQNVQCV